MIRVRFAPGPTGSLHVGNALSAVINRREGDWMLLRIDDTDPARNVAGGEEAIPLAAGIFLDVFNIFLLFLRLFARR